MKDVVDVTKGLFALSKVRVYSLHEPSDLKTESTQETAQLESEAFVQRQKVALAAEVKAVLDSWVRYEQQAKENEQAELAKTVIDNVLKSIKDEKTQKDILTGALAEIERTSFHSPLRLLVLTFYWHRIGQEQSNLDNRSYLCICVKID